MPSHHYDFETIEFLTQFKGVTIIKHAFSRVTYQIHRFYKLVNVHIE